MEPIIVCKNGTEIRNINDFNREYMYRIWSGEIETSKEPHKKSAVKNVIFYSVLLAAVALAFFYSGSKEPGKRFGPFTYNTVLTESMNSVSPKGSLITSWAIRPDEPLEAGLETGTDIVFLKEDGTVIVHRIIEIIEDYEDSGQRAFRTQGVDNPAPDSWITYEGNVLGRVTWHLPYAGDILLVIAENILWVVLITVALAFILTLFQTAFRKKGSR